MQQNSVSVSDSNQPDILPADVTDGQVTPSCVDDTGTQQVPGEGTQQAHDEGEQSAPDDLQQPTPGSDRWYAADSADFAVRFPDVDRQALFDDDYFLDYAQGKVGVIPLADIYEGYRRLLTQLGRREQVQAARQASPGSLRQVALDAGEEYYSLQQMQSMSAAYIEQHWDKVQQSLKRLSNQQ